MAVNGCITENRRLGCWLMLTVCTVVTLGNLLSVSLHLGRGWQATVAIVVSSITLVLGATFTLILLGKTTLVGSEVEICAIICSGLLWICVLPIIFSHHTDLTTSRLGYVRNANIYYFSWGALISTFLLFKDFLMQYNEINIIERLEERGSRFPFWLLLFLLSSIVMTSSVDTYFATCIVTQIASPLDDSCITVDLHVPPALCPSYIPSVAPSTFPSEFPIAFSPGNNSTNHTNGTSISSNLTISPSPVDLNASLVMPSLTPSLSPSRRGTVNSTMAPSVIGATPSSSSGNVGGRTLGSRQLVVSRDKKLQTSFCRRTVFAVSLGAACAFLCLIMLCELVYLGDEVRRLFESEALFSGLMSVAYFVGISYVTSKSGPAPTIGNLYYSIWASSILSVFLVLHCFRERAKKVERRHIERS